MTLPENPDLIDLYLYHIGKSEVPKQFHLWACLSMMAACVSDRVWVQINPVNRVYSNLYVFLIGPSGSGKEKAISTALKFVQGGLDRLRGYYESIGVDPAYVEQILNPYAGMATKQSILEFFVLGSKPDPRGVRKATREKFYFVTEELANSLNTPALAHELVKLMTALFVPPAVPIMEGTRTNGFVELENTCLNWLAGTTDEWLLECVPKTSIEGGFFARVCSVRGRRDYKHRHPQIIYPCDYEQIREEILRRVEALMWLAGSYQLSKEAQERHDAWYMDRPAPKESVLEPTFNRADEMVYKLALLLAIADWPGTFDDEGNVTGHEAVIQLEHLNEAIELWDSLAMEIPATIRVANMSAQTRDVDIAEDAIKRAKTITRHELMRSVNNRGLNKERLDKALDTLIDRECVKEHTEMTPGATKPRRWYVWMERVGNGESK